MSHNNEKVMDSINNTLKKIKIFLNSLNRRDDIFIVLIIILVGFSGFGLGRLSKIEEGSQPVRIENIPTNKKDSSSNSLLPGQYVASVKGSKYHFPWCPGAQRMKEANKIWFFTEEEAQKAGYTPAKNCKGLGP